MLMIIMVSMMVVRMIMIMIMRHVDEQSDTLHKNIVHVDDNNGVDDGGEDDNDHDNETC